MTLRALAPAAVAALLGGLTFLMLLGGDAPEEFVYEETDLSPVRATTAEHPPVVARRLVTAETDGVVATGRIVDADGAPVPDVAVALLTVPETTLDPDLRWLFDREPRPLWAVHAAGRTDADGRYSFAAASPFARTMLRIDAGGPHATLFSDLPQTAADGVVDHGRFVLPRRRPFIGRVVDSRGHPVARAVVRLIPEFHLPWEGALSDLRPLHWIARSQPTTAVPAPHCLTDTFSIVPTRRVRTDREGRFRLFAAPGLRGTVSVDHQWFERQLLDLRLDDPSVVRDLGEISLTPPRNVAGRVVDRVGRPIAGAELGAGVLRTDGSGLAYRFTATDAAGEFELSKLFDRDHLVLVRRAGDFDWSSHGPFAPGDDPLELTVRHARVLTVRVVDSAGATVAPAELALHPADDERSAFETALAPYPPRVAADGTARIEGLRPRPYRVAARAPGFAPESGEVDLTRNDRELWVTLDRECALSVRVVDDANGRPVAGARVVAREVSAESALVTDRLLGLVATATTEDDGRATLEHLAPARYELEVRRPGYAPRWRTVSAPADDVVLGLERGGALTGRLTFRERPLAGRRVVLRLLDRPRHGLPPTRIALSATDGSFAFRGLPPGTHALDVRLAEGYVTGGDLPHGSLLETAPDLTLPVALTAGRTVHEEVDIAHALDGPGRLVHGTLRFQGTPLEGTLVQAWVEAPDEGWSAATLTDEDGAFVLGVTEADAVTVVVDALGLDDPYAVDGAPLRLDVRGAFLRGILRGRRPAVGARIRLSGPDGTRLAYTDAAGAFRFGLAAPGSYSLHADVGGYVARTFAVDVPDRGGLEPLDLVLRTSR